jgi:hypothetical protein
METSHLDVLPVPTVDDATALDFSKRVTKILERNIHGNNEITCGNSYCPL